MSMSATSILSKKLLMKFNARDLDAQALLARAREEATEIFSKESTRRDRTLNTITETCLYGHSAELYLISQHGFKDDQRPYKDLYDTSGNSVEVKVTEGSYYVPYVLKRLNAAKQQTWRNFPDIAYIFIGDKKTYDYELDGIYHWNETLNRFTKQQN